MTTDLQCLAAEICRIGELIRTQDNRATDAPMFIVQERIRDYGYADEYADGQDWIDVGNAHAVATDLERRGLDAMEDGGDDIRGNWQKVGYRDRWEFVTACFTEQGCKDFITADGHNHGELRIYADGSYRNEEFRAVREWLKSMQTGQEPGDTQ